MLVVSNWGPPKFSACLSQGVFGENVVRVLHSRVARISTFGARHRRCKRRRPSLSLSLRDRSCQLHDVLWSRLETVKAARIAIARTTLDALGCKVLVVVPDRGRASWGEIQRTVRTPVAPSLDRDKGRFHSSHSRIAGSIESARCAGIHVAESGSYPPQVVD